MKTSQRLLTLTAGAWLAGSAMAGPLYVTGIGNQFGRIDVGTRTYTEVQANLGTGYANLAWNPAAGVLYTYPHSDTEPVTTLTVSGTLGPNIGNPSSV